MCDITRERLEELSEKFGNAFYILDSKIFEENYERLSREFKKIYPNFNIAYSYKTNYTPKLCKIVNKKGGYGEVVSDMELEIALRVGVPPSKIIWNGPVKDSLKAKELLLTGGTINIDSVHELEMIKELSESCTGRIFNVGIRCNFDVGDGVVSRFGIDSESDEFLNTVKFIEGLSNVHLISLQCHFAKRNVEYWHKRATGMAQLVKQVSKIMGYLPERIDLGGGIYGNMEESLKEQFSYRIPSYKDYAREAGAVIAKEFPDELPELIIEPGSALAGDSMRFVGRVETIKEVRGKTFITILGSQKNISMGNVNPPIKVVSTGGEGKYYKGADIVGYTCIENDVMYRGFEGEIAVGDYIIFSNCGSYSIVMKPPFILPNFPIIDIGGEEAQVIKRKENFDDIFHTYTF